MNNKILTVDKIVEICKNAVISRGTESTVGKICSDTRQINEGDLFISFKSELGDGTKYIEEALKKGAMGVITEYEITEKIKSTYNNKLLIKVKDVINTVQQLAEYKRSLYDIPVVAITGSVGKTSTKDIIASVLEQEFNVVKTKGNYNNHIGVPLTILNWDEETEAAVVEMGMNHFGEIEKLTKIAKPTVAVITNIGTAHIGLLGSRENILKAKLEILEGLTNNGKIIINNDNDLLHTCNTKKYKKITYGINNLSDYMAYNIKRNENCSEYKIHLEEKEENVLVPMPGEHFIYNSLCAIAVGKTLKIENKKIINGIKKFEMSKNRNEIINVNNLKIINDFYNASYDSMQASLGVLKSTEGNRKIAILGDMLELGKYSETLHRKVGEEVVKNKIDILCTVGKLANFIADQAKKIGTCKVYEFNTNKECIDYISEIVKKGDCILLKASNAMHFGEISEFLQGDKLWKKLN